MAIEFMAVGTSPQSMATIPAPDDWGWGLNDISASDAGRVQDEGNTMYKNRTSQKRKLSPTWKNRDGATVARILQAFNPEYVFVRYLDAMDNAYEVREFYTGDKAVKLRKVQIGRAEYSSLTFNIIER